MRKFLILTLISTFVSIKVFSQFDIKFNKATLEKDTSRRGDISFLFNKVKYDTVLLANKNGYIEELRHLEMTAGTIYFSGTGFSRVPSSPCRGRLSCVWTFLNQCVSGSKITFEKCTFKNDDGTITNILNKSIFIK